MVQLEIQPGQQICSAGGRLVETLGIKPDKPALIHSFAPPHPVSVTSEEDRVHGDLRRDTSAPNTLLKIIHSRSLENWTPSRDPCILKGLALEGWTDILERICGVAKEEDNIGFLSCDKMPGKINVWICPGLGFEGAVRLTRKAEQQEHEAAGHTVHSREEGPLILFHGTQSTGLCS